jgi:hypothetical protein
VIKKVITYLGYDEKEHTGEYYFNLNLDDLMVLDASEEGGLALFLDKTVKSGDAQAIMRQFRRIILAAYGDRMEDNSFKHDPESAERFIKSPAYDALFLDLMSDPTVVSEFINGMVPPQMLERLEAVSKKSQERQAAAETTPEEPPWANREPTNKELMTMTHEQLLDVYRRRAEKQASQE